MSAECNKCGSDIAYPEGTWPVGECPTCTRDETIDRYRAALVECATISGADVSDGIPTWPDVDVWAVAEVRQLRADYDEAIA